MNERLLPFLIHMWLPLIFCSFFLNFAWWLWKECAALRETQLSKRYNKKTCCHERIYFISIYYRLLRIYWLYEYYKLSLISQGFDRGDITANLKSLNTSYRVSQQVWEMLNVTFWSSEKFASKASYFYKILTQ